MASFAAGLREIGFANRLGTVDALPEWARQTLFLTNIIGAVVIASGISLFVRGLIGRAESDLQTENARADQLLRAILPGPIAAQLKVDEDRVFAEKYDGETVLFADIVGIPERTARTETDRMVRELNQVFSRIDDLAAARGVAKIKTIGDAYVAIGGPPNPMADHCERTADLALDLRRATAGLAATVRPGLRFRMVMHSGPVVAGVIGRTKFAFDVRGDTVSTAARLEEVCLPGEVLMTEATRRILPARFQVAARGTVELRDKGAVEVFRLIDSDAEA